MRLLLARHGATPNNAEQRYTGQSDVPLSPLGERQAEALAQRLATEWLDGIVASDLSRARATAEAIARFHRVPVHLDADLREISMGEWEGSTYAEILDREPEAMRIWQADPTSYAPPGGETVAQVRDRLVAALERWRQAYPKGTVVWVTHGGVIGILLCQLLGMDLNRRWQFRRDNAALTELDLGDDYAILMRLNDLSHLRELMGEGTAEERQVL